MDGQEQGEDMELFSWDRVVAIAIALVFLVDETKDITSCFFFRGVVKIFISLRLKVLKLSCIQLYEHIFFLWTSAFSFVLNMLLAYLHLTDSASL